MFWDPIKMINEHWIQLKHHIIARQQNGTKHSNTRHCLDLQITKRPASSPMMHLYWPLVYKGLASVVKLNWCVLCLFTDYYYWTEELGWTSAELDLHEFMQLDKAVPLQKKAIG